MCVRGGQKKKIVVGHISVLFENILGDGIFFLFADYHIESNILFCFLK